MQVDCLYYNMGINVNSIPYLVIVCYNETMIPSIISIRKEASRRHRSYRKRVGEVHINELHQHQIKPRKPRNLSKEAQAQQVRASEEARKNYPASMFEHKQVPQRPISTYEHDSYYTHAKVYKYAATSDNYTPQFPNNR